MDGLRERAGEWIHWLPATRLELAATVVVGALWVAVVGGLLGASVRGALAGFARFMDAAPPLLPMLLLTTLVTIPAVLLHELGHATVIRSRLDSEVEVTVGSKGRLLQLEIDGISISLHLWAAGALAGAARFDPRRATFADVVAIALAGPLTSAVGLVAGVLVYRVAPAAGLVHGVAWAFVLASAFGVLNVLPFKREERRGSRPIRSDGRLALEAIRLARGL